MIIRKEALIIGMQADCVYVTIEYKPEIRFLPKIAL